LLSVVVRPWSLLTYLYSLYKGEWTRSVHLNPLYIYRIFARGLFSENAIFICDRGTGAQQLSGLVMSEIHRRRKPTSWTVKILSFHLSGIIADHRRNLGRVGR